jgi:hypothetical protein
MPDSLLLQGETAMHDTNRRIETVVKQNPEITTPIFKSSIVPQSFRLGGLKIDVLLDDTLVNTKKVIGEAHYVDQTIVLDTAAAPRQSVEQAFLHELTHWIFYIMNEDELRGNEKLVDVFAHFLYQALVTAEPFPQMLEEQPGNQGE